MGTTVLRPYRPPLVQGGPSVRAPDRTHDNRALSFPERLAWKHRLVSGFLPPNCLRRQERARGNTASLLLNRFAKLRNTCTLCAIREWFRHRPHRVPAKGDPKTTLASQLPLGLSPRFGVTLRFACLSAA